MMPLPNAPKEKMEGIAMQGKTPDTDAFYKQHPICEYEQPARPEDCDAWLDFARTLESQRNHYRDDNEALKRANMTLSEQVNELNAVLRAAGWGQGEIDSAYEAIHKAEEQAKLYQSKYVKQAILALARKEES